MATNNATATTADNSKRRGPPPMDERIAPAITAIDGAVPIPETITRARRGIKSQYPFDQLEIGQSFGVTNKTLKQINSVVSTQNRKHLVPKVDANGQIVTRPVVARTADGKTIETAGTKPVMVAGKRFVCAEVNPKTDPAKASVRVWRIAVA